MYDWNKNLNDLSSITGLNTLAINRNLTSVVPDDFEKFVGYLNKNVSAEVLDKIVKSSVGIRMKEVYVDMKFENEPNSLKLD